jgi:AraC-like DNA-binding protein
MNLQLYDIIPPLQPYVRVICSVEKPYGSEEGSFRILPDTCVEIFFNYTNTTIAKISGKTKFDSKGSFVTSRMSSYMDVQLPEGSSSIAVCFRPGVAFPFFNLPMKELTDDNVLLSEVWGKQVHELEDRLAALVTNEERVKLIQRFLLNFIGKETVERNDYDYCLWQINLLRGKVPLKTISRKTNVSNRQLSRQFNTYLGLSPKEYARVIRFLHSIENLKKFPLYSLTQIAYESGYFDQSHFIHDSKEFSGMTPGELQNHCLMSVSYNFESL